jgi:hypothetical protein
MRFTIVAILAPVLFACGGFASEVPARAASPTPRDAKGCAAIQDAYASALKQAQVCDPALRDSCAATRPGTPQDVCKCQVAVNPARTAQLDELLERFRSQGCPLDQPFCNRGACKVPAQRCLEVAGGSPICS